VIEDGRFNFVSDGSANATEQRVDTPLSTPRSACAAQNVDWFTYANDLRRSKALIVGCDLPGNGRGLRGDSPDTTCH
jgi:hypothetical protein